MAYKVRRFSYSFSGETDMDESSIRLRSPRRSDKLDRFVVNFFIACGVEFYLCESDDFQSIFYASCDEENRRKHFSRGFDLELAEDSYGNVAAYKFPHGVRSLTELDRLSISIDTAFLIDFGWDMATFKT
jgi:hypothetical protein